MEVRPVLRTNGPGKEFCNVAPSKVASCFCWCRVFVEGAREARIRAGRRFAPPSGRGFGVGSSLPVLDPVLQKFETNNFIHSCLQFRVHVQPNSISLGIFIEEPGEFEATVVYNRTGALGWQFRAYVQPNTIDLGCQFPVHVQPNAISLGIFIEAFFDKCSR